MSEDVKRMGRELAYQGTVLKVYKDHMKFSNGNTEDWDFIHHDGAAAVIPVMDDGKILMVKQYRNALERDTLEIPAGKLDDPDEEGIVCASRELKRPGTVPMIWNGSLQSVQRLRSVMKELKSLLQGI